MMKVASVENFRDQGCRPRLHRFRLLVCHRNRLRMTYYYYRHYEILTGGGPGAYARYFLSVPDSVRLMRRH